jgi:hypothetical protein
MHRQRNVTLCESKATTLLSNVTEACSQVLQGDVSDMRDPDVTDNTQGTYLQSSNQRRLWN